MSQVAAMLQPQHNTTTTAAHEAAAPHADRGRERGTPLAGRSQSAATVRAGRAASRHVACDVQGVSRQRDGNQE